MRVRNDVAEGAAVGAAAVAVAVTYGIYAVHPWQGAPALSQFLAEFGRADTAAWPAQIVCYAAALVMVGLALWAARRWSWVRGAGPPGSARPSAPLRPGP